MVPRNRVVESELGVGVGGVACFQLESESVFKNAGVVVGFKIVGSRSRFFELEQFMGWSRNVESYLKFLLFLIKLKLSFFWYDCYRRWQGKETHLRSQSFILGDTIQYLTPLPRTGMFNKNWRAILVEVAGPKAPHWIIPKSQHFPRTSLTVIAPPSIHFVTQLVEYPFKPLL